MFDAHISNNVRTGFHGSRPRPCSSWTLAFGNLRENAIFVADSGHGKAISVSGTQAQKLSRDNGNRSERVVEFR